MEEVAEALHAVALRVAHAALQQVAQRMLQVAEVHEIIGQVVEDVVRLERGDFLGAVPHRVPVSQRHVTSTRPRGGPIDGG